MGRLRGAAAAVLVVAVLLASALLGLASEVAAGEERWPGPLDWVRRNAWLAAGLFVAVAAVGALVVERLRPGASAGASGGVPPGPVPTAVPEWVVDREQAAQVAAAVRARGRGTVGITTGLQGAGGFGKTVLAQMVAADKKVRRRFRGRVYVVVIGRDVRGRAQIAGKVAEVTRLITGDTTAFEDPDLAGRHLARLLAEQPRTLLVLDDVWTPEQLAPFLHGDEGFVRLVTTRVAAVLPAGNGTVRVPVDAMSTGQARRVLVRDLPDLPTATVEGLLRVTGRWPLLLRMVNRHIAAEIGTGVPPHEAASDVLARLAAAGPAAVDPGDIFLLDVADPEQRNRSAAACLEAAIRLLPAGGRERFAELGVFAEDEVIPIALVARLWQTTAGLTPPQARALLRDLDGLSLLACLDGTGGGTVTLHDVVRDYLRHTLLTPAQLTALHGALVDAAAAGLPPAPALAASTPAPAVAWWTLPDGYLADHVVAHMVAAGRATDAEALAGDIRWVEARLEERGPTAPWTDLTRVPTPRAARMARNLAQTTHLLAPTDPTDALGAVLHSRLQDLPDWHDQVTARQQQLPGPRLVNAWPLPDLPHPALQRTLTGHTGSAYAVAISPDGTWLAATGSDDRSVRIWGAQGHVVRAVTRAAEALHACAWAPDSRHLAVGGAGGLYLCEYRP